MDQNTLSLEHITGLFEIFFFSQTSSLPLGLCRFFLSFTIFFKVLFSFEQIALFINPKGLYPAATAQKSSPNGISFFYSFSDSKFWVYFLLILLLVSSFCLGIGFKSNFFSILTWLLWTSYQRRMGPLRSSGDGIAGVFFFLFMFADVGSAFSLDCWLNEHNLGFDQKILAWPVRLMQIQICAFYWKTFYQKIQSQNWRSGLAVRNAVLLPLWGLAWGRRFVVIPILGRTSNFIVLATQAVAPFLLWISETRIYAIFFVACMHIGMMLFLRVLNFGFVMLSCLLLFV